eukprot:jgi/Tetstr1/458225/TSEL_044713.t1
MYGSGSPIAPKMVDAGKAAAVEGVGTEAIEQDPTEAARQLESPEFSELLELYKDRVYGANITSAAKTTARQRFGGALRRNDRDRDGGGGCYEDFKTTRPWREAVAPRAAFAKDANKDYGKSKAKVEPLSVDKAQ